MEVCDMFNEFKLGAIIPVSNFINTYKYTISKVPSNSKPQVNDSISASTKELEQKILKCAYLRLQKKIRETGL